MNTFPSRLSCPMCRETVAQVDFYKHGFLCTARMDATERAERRRSDRAAAQHESHFDEPADPLLSGAAAVPAPGHVVRPGTDIP